MKLTGKGMRIGNLAWFLQKYCIYFIGEYLYYTIGNFIIMMVSDLYGRIVTDLLPLAIQRSFF